MWSKVRKVDVEFVKTMWCKVRKVCLGNRTTSETNSA